MRRRPPLAAFTFGYDGWGSAARQLVRMVDAVEAARGFAPPLFVDIRFSRGGRAVGFRDKAFAALLGPERYAWMPDLGNANIGSGKSGVRIVRPAAASELLDRIVRAAPTRRVIFFCHCHSPTAARFCHRSTVARLLRRRARERDLELTVSEWPGDDGFVAAGPLALPAAELARLARGARTVRLGRLALADAGRLPHCGLVEVQGKGERLLVETGPVTCAARGWAHPVYGVWPLVERRAAVATSQRDRRQLGLAPRSG